MKTITMETIYRKVAVSERLPKINGNYLTDKYRSFYFSQEVNKFMDDEGDFIYPKYWLEPIPDPTAQLQSDKAELLELRSTIEEFRDKANQSADNLHKRGLQSSGMCSQAMETAYNLCLIEIESLIQKHKQ